MQTNLYNKKGEISGKIDLPENIFNSPWKADLVHQIIVSEADNKRKVTASTKDRAQVSGGGRKPWKQKHTGRARHGSTRSPIWKGGGVSHGPKKEAVFGKKINKKMKQLAIAAILSAKLRDNELFIIDSFSFGEVKTKVANSVFQEFFKNTNKISKAKKPKIPSTLVLLPKSDKEFIRAMRNLSYASVMESRNINATDLLSKKVIVLPKDGIDVIKNTLSRIGVK